MSLTPEYYGTDKAMQAMQATREPIKMRLKRERVMLAAELNRIDRCIKLLEEHPEFETFMDTFNR